MDFLQVEFYHNTVLQWLIAVLVLSLFLPLFALLRVIVTKRLHHLFQKTRTDLDDFLVELLHQTKFFLSGALGLYLAALTLKLPATVQSIISVLLIIALLAQAGVWGSSVIKFWIQRFTRQRFEEDPSSVTTISALNFVGRLVLWAIVLLLMLENLGISVTGLVAGLGIGGIAIALALQNILGDLFASLSIVLDKPFVIGDFIIVDDYMGVVKQVGLKTTRIQSLSGEQLIFANHDLLGSRIRNYKRMDERRVAFTIGVTYETPFEMVKAIPAMLKKAVEEQQNVRFDRAHFKEYGDFSLNYETVYYIGTADYNAYMDTQQAINLTIFRVFEQQGISFAYPTQTLYLNQSSTDPDVRSPE
jgi:small-conductance mechanosensitive channel